VKISPLCTVGALLSLPLFCAAITWATGVHLNTTASMPLGVWRETAEVPARNSVVKTCIPERAAHLARTRDYLSLGLCPGWVQPVLKYVAAVGGDVVELSATGMKVNGAVLPHTAPQNEDSCGRPLRAWPFGRYIVRHGEAWLVVPLPRSFDSRYFGPVDVRGLSRRMSLVQRF